MSLGEEILDAEHRMHAITRRRGKMPLGCTHSCIQVQRGTGRKVWNECNCRETVERRCKVHVYVWERLQGSQVKRVHGICACVRHGNRMWAVCMHVCNCKEARGKKSLSCVQVKWARKATMHVCEERLGSHLAK